MTVDPRAELLARVVDRFLSGASTKSSLRAIATEVGSSHRMLLYHFGSTEGLIAAVVDEVESRQRDALRGLADVDGDLRSVSHRFWRLNSSAELLPLVRLFFDLYARLLDTGDTERAALLVEAWLSPVTALMTDAGVPPRRAEVLARLGLAVTRGLLLDLLATGDRAAVDAAMDSYIDLAFAAPE